MTEFVMPPGLALPMLSSEAALTLDVYALVEPFMQEIDGEDWEVLDELMQMFEAESQAEPTDGGSPAPAASSRAGPPRRG